MSKRALTYLDDAQAALDKLTAERDAALEQVRAWISENGRGGWIDNLRNAEQARRIELDSLKASPAVNVDEAMRLADEWVVEAIHAALAANSGHTTLADPDAAREALCAYLVGKP